MGRTKADGGHLTHNATKQTELAASFGNLRAFDNNT